MKKAWFLDEDGRAPRTLYVMHDHRKCGSKLEFMHVVKQNPTEPQIFNVEDNKWGKAEHILKWDFLSNSTAIPLANKKALEFLNNLCPDDFQAIPTILRMPNGSEITEYHLINVINGIHSACFEKSIINERNRESQIISMKYNKIFHYMNISKDRYLARDKDCISVLLCSDNFKKEIKKHKLTGLTFKDHYTIHYFLPQSEL